jgi:isoquinoline 1-oxidoreductase beta subunit
VADWKTPAPEGRFRGIALDECFGSIAAHVAEVSVSEEGVVSVHRVVAVLDCGIVVNRRAALAQIEGATMQGVSAALAEAITLVEVRVVETNFDRYRELTLAEAPRVEAHLLESGEAPGGVGEPALPPVAPAGFSVSGLDCDTPAASIQADARWPGGRAGRSSLC